MRYRILPYKQGSKSAKALAGALGGKVLKLVGSSFVPTSGDLIINWGRTDTGIDCDRLLNFGPAVHQASNKLKFFERMTAVGLDIHVPRYWTAAASIPSDVYPVVCRTVLAGHSGEGIVIANSPDELVPAPLYVQYVKKKEEYRIHVGKNSAGSASIIIDSQQKKRRKDHDSPNWKVRNHANGFIYARQGIDIPENVLTAAQLALAATDLDFGAVDVTWNEQEKKAYVLEINTAPGLEGQTVVNYGAFFKSLGEPVA